MIKVKLISFTPNPENLVASSAKLCYSNSSVETISEGLTDEKIASFIDMLATMGHESPMEHICFTFGIEGVSRSLLAQFTRHRIASFSVQSQRYVGLSNFEFVVPPEIENNKVAKDEYLKAMQEANEHYLSLLNILKNKYITEYKKNNPNIDEKKFEKQAEKKALEDARFVLPNACTTKIVCTMNARSLLHFFELRCCNRAQWEIRELATQMLRLVTRVAPNIFKFAGPPCFKGQCKEGKMNCGKKKETVELFTQIHKEVSNSIES